MYLAHWGLQESQFAGGATPGTCFANPAHDEALARMKFLSERRRGIGLLLGGAGVGKSLLLEVLAADMRRQGGVAVRVALEGLEPVELLAALAIGWRLDPPRDATQPQLWASLRDRLAEHGYQKLATVVLLDDADRASAAVREQVIRLAQLDIFHEARLAIVLSARPDGLARLGRRLLELSDLRIDLAPWELADTEGYIQHALAKAGRTSPAFESSAPARLHELTGGTPRSINQVADLALLAAAAQGLRLVDRDTIEAVVDELGVPAAAGVV